jgi:hypothetical protein
MGSNSQVALRKYRITNGTNGSFAPETAETRMSLYFRTTPES